MSLRTKKNKRVFHVDESELLCKNGCGFYGNMAWQGYCSKCWREVCHQKQKQEEKEQIESDERFARQLMEQEQSALAAAGVPMEAPPTTPPVVDSVQTSNFEKFEEKRKHKLQAVSRAKQVKSLLQKTKSPNKVEISQPAHPKVQKQLSTESQTASQAFKEFLKTLSKGAGDDIQRQCKAFAEQLLSVVDQYTVEEQAEKVQDFYQLMIERMDKSPFYKGYSEENRKTILDQIEKFLMTRLYWKLFSPALTDDEQKDLAIQNRIRRLHWVTADMLESVLDDQNMEVQDLITRAQTELIEMNAKRAPVEKLTCVVNCSKFIFRIIQKCQNITASADEYLPILIYMILQANPPQLHSNIQYISRFSNPTRLLQGEAGYYFTNLCCAITFVENLDAKSLSLSQEKYDNYMSGKEVPPGRKTEEPICEGLRMMYANLSALEELRIRQETLMRNAREFSEEIEQWKQSITNQVQEVLTTKPLIIKRYTKQPVAIDKDVTDEIQGLPIPLEPQKLIQLKMSKRS